MCYGPEISLTSPMNFLRPFSYSPPVLSPQHPRSRTGANLPIILGGLPDVVTITVYVTTGAVRDSENPATRRLGVKKAPEV
jgi:hypothetical protein